jgi:hypothetical protein
MAKQPESTKAVKEGISFASKFGLDPERKKLGVITNEKAKPPTLSPGENFSILAIKMSKTKKKYSHTDPETDELVEGKIPIAQIDIRTEAGEIIKVYSPNSAIIEACRAIIDDEDFGYNKETGKLSTPANISRVIEGEGSNNRKYIAFQ